MTKPVINQFVGNDIKNNEASQVIRKARRRLGAETLDGLSVQARTLIETKSRTDSENGEPGKQMAVKRNDAAILPMMAKDNTELARLVSVESRKRAKLVVSLQKEYQARLRAEAKLRQLQIEFKVLAKRSVQAAHDNSAAEFAQLLTLEAAGLHAEKSQTARIEAERKLKAEQAAAELLRSQAEMDRNSWQLQEQTNVLLRKAEQKAQERLATETMASKAAAFKLKTERELAVIAEQLAYAELQTAREVELKLRAETSELAMINERLAIMQRARRLSNRHIDTETCATSNAAKELNQQADQAECDGEGSEILALK
jgi:hypothetical protein